MSLDLDRALTSELTRRAAAHLCDRFQAPSADPRRATIPSRRSSPSSRSTPPTPTPPLVSRRHDLRDRAIALAMEQTQPAE